MRCRIWTRDLPLHRRRLPAFVCPICLSGKVQQREHASYLILEPLYARHTSSLSCKIVVVVLHYLCRDAWELLVNMRDAITDKAISKRWSEEVDAALTIWETASDSCSSFQDQLSFFVNIGLQMRSTHPLSNKLPTFTRSTASTPRGL